VEALWTGARSRTSCGNDSSRCCPGGHAAAVGPAARRWMTGPAPTGILFVLTTGIRWDRLPQQLGYGSGMTCWRRLRDWQAAGVWEWLHALLPAELHAAGRIDWPRAVADSSHIRAKRG
jgi:transposase